MSNLSTTGGASVDFSDDLTWSDEYEFHPVSQTAQRTITGALIISSLGTTGGRPITLSPDDEGPWLARSTVDALRSLAAVPGQQLTLTLRGQTYQVIFRHQDTSGVAVDAQPVIPFNAPVDADWYTVTLRLMEL